MLALFSSDLLCGVDCYLSYWYRSQWGILGQKTMPSNSDWDGLHRRGNGCDDTKSEVIGELVLKHSFVEENGYWARMSFHVRVSVEIMQIVQESRTSLSHDTSQATWRRQAWGVLMKRFCLISVPFHIIVRLYETKRSTQRSCRRI